MARARERQPVTAGVVVRSTLQTVFFLLTMSLWALVSVLTYPLPYRARYRFITLWTHLNLWWLEFVCRLRCDVQGLEHIPAGGGIVMAKHQSTWETMALQRWFDPQTWVLKREIMRLPFFGWAMAMLEPIAIDRSARTEAVRQMCEEGAERLQDGRWVVVFPEGTRMAPGQRGRYRVGGGVLAERTGATVIPVAHNAGRFWGRNAFLKWPGVIQVRIGPPISPQGKSAAQIVQEAEDWIEGQMAELNKR
jgi:1-acyl-sn-glycerol-3-phosphate acyltransferase